LATAKSRTTNAPRRQLRSSPRAYAAFDWNATSPVGVGETWPVFCAGLVLGFFATLVCYAKGYVLLYGDAVAHLAIARRILDAHWPGLAQLGGVWLPLPHLLIMPFVQKMDWWQSGLGGAPMSVISYAASAAGVWRLARRMMPARWALVAALFYALNANLLFLSSTAMTEALFLALLVWSAIACVEGAAALRGGAVLTARRWMWTAGVLVMAMVFTRYDGWIAGAVVWCVLAWHFVRAEPATRRSVRTAFVGMTLLCVAGPLLWFAYNAKFEHDWLDFVRGPYSAAAIERKTAPPGQHYRGWHNMGWALLFYTRTAQVDASAWETGWAVMLAAIAGLAVSLRKTLRAENAALLLWLPLPFYVYSVAYGSVPIFIPQLWPHSYYNARYGMELLPALALYAVLALAQVDTWLRAGSSAPAKIGARLFQPAMALLCVANSIAMMYRVPLVLKEGMVNATTRVAFEHAIAMAMDDMPRDARIMMYTSAHVGAVQVAGRTLRSIVSEMDNDAWQQALKDPAGSADYVIAIAGDPTDTAVRAHPEGLDELQILCTTGQPCARIYHSSMYRSQPAR
jgi:hypothetical protein